MGVCWGVLGMYQSIDDGAETALTEGPVDFQGGREYKIFEKYLNPPKSLSYVYY